MSNPDPMDVGRTQPGQPFEDLQPGGPASGAPTSSTDHPDFAEGARTTAGLPAENAGTLFVTFQSSSREGETIELNAGEHTVGRRSKNDVVLDGGGFEIVSGTHARFFVQAGAWWVDDLDSTNGTYVNGRKIHTATRVQSGDLVELGRPRDQGRIPAIQLKVRLDLAAMGAPDPAQDPAEMEHTIVSDAAAFELAPGEDSVSTGAGSTMISGTPPIDVAPEGAPTVGSFDFGSGDSTVGEALPGSSDPGSRQVPAVDDAGLPTMASAGPPGARPGVDAGIEHEAAGDGSGVDPINLREHLSAIQEKNRRLGGVSFQLDGLVRGMLEAMISRVREEPDGTSLATSAEGTELRNQILERDRLEVDLVALEAEAPKLRERNDLELAPLARTAEEAQRRSDEAKGALAEAIERRREDFQAYQRQLDGARSLVEEALKSVLAETSAEGETELDIESEPPTKGQGPWRFWAEALKSSNQELELRIPSLETAAAQFGDSGDAEARARAEWEHAAAEVTDALRVVQVRRDEIDAAIRDNADRTEAAKARLESLRGGLEMRAETLIRDSLAGRGDESLSALPSYAEARKLTDEAARIEAELDDLQSRIAGR